MFTSLRAATVGFAIMSTASAVSLSSFTPRILVSNAQCQAAYTTTITGCVSGDFTPGARCSAACIDGLNKIGDVVKRVCKDVDVGETSIIGVFQNDVGARALCPSNFVSNAPAAPSSTRAPAQSSAQLPASRATSTSAQPATTLTTSTSVSSSTAESEAAQPSNSSGGIAVDPQPTSIANAPTNVVPPASAAPPATGPTRAPNAQLSNADSGGGSPFDVQPTSSSSRIAIDVSIAAFLSTALLFVVCA